METLDTSLPYISQYSYLGVYLLILVFSVVPLSKTLVIATAGVLASQGVGQAGLYLPVAMLALLTADGGYYLLGRLGGARVSQWRPLRSEVNVRRLQRAAEIFRRHGGLAVFSARFLPFVRSFIFIIAGVNRFSVARFVAADLASAAIYVPLALGLGYLVGQNRERLVRYTQQGEWWLAALVVAGLVLWLLLRYRRRG